jgi:hypothetical protein
VAWGIASLVDASTHTSMCERVHTKSQSLAINVINYRAFGSDVIVALGMYSEGSTVSFSRAQHDRLSVFSSTNLVRSVRDWSELPIPRWAQPTFQAWARRVVGADYTAYGWRSEFVTMQARGWPMRSLWCCRRFNDESGAWELLPANSAIVGLGVPPTHVLNADDRQSLPLRVSWPGFAINTIFYAAMLWLLWIAPGRIKRVIRIRGHRCPACGYQIAPGGGIGPVCSECGAALPAAWSTNASS